MKNILYLFTTLILFSCSTKKQISTVATNTKPLELVNPALPGDNPDPSMIRVGNTYYATSTTNEWAPYFTIYKSTDLKNWTLINHVFPNGFKDMKDQWGENNFWASELAYDKKQHKIYAYYTAHNRNTKGNPGLQCGTAWIDADKIETGKFKDNGPVIIEDDCGAIDAFEMEDNGKIYAFWKNDGNGCGKESWIWMQEINDTRTKLLGTKRKVYTNSQPWETALVEGACFFKFGDYIYSLYAVGGCCDARCNYKTGIARTKSLESGVWEKYPQNPIMVSNEKWRCPGHGTVVTTEDGRLLMLYHAFNMQYDVFVGREGVIEELVAGEDGWPILKNNITANRPKSDLDFTDNFKNDKSLNLVWQWPSKKERPELNLKNGLQLKASNENHNLGTFIGQYIKSTDFTVKSSIQITSADVGMALGGAIYKSTWPGELGGIGISASKNGFKIFTNYENQYQIVKQIDKVLSGEIELKMNVLNQARTLEFYYKEKNSDWIKMETLPFDADKYAPWGMGYRVGITAKGDNDFGSFNSFEVRNN
ncbi:glycoside hydrolase family 43 protein [Flavobacterium sp. LHD-80]|uniref:glycoside hydrolase family 43 protein n=1 Tax=Flavobacterium sp. LHD-80 TaxID=3071411 RepID=UPI0027E190B6|nr:glycoside hydrolase family 43 protein [Flavobacterium sp. LHD-80]MDQ6473012.1 glycoside hydrolase family 43 protein [Flavobacterium sp. LHD-80]